MQVAVDGDAVVLLKQLGDQHLDVVHSGEGLLHCVLVLTVQVCSRQIASFVRVCLFLKFEKNIIKMEPCVAHNNTVRINHGHNLEDVVLPQRLRNVRLSCDKVVFGTTRCSWGLTF